MFSTQDTEHTKVHVRKLVGEIKRIVEENPQVLAGITTSSRTAGRSVQNRQAVKPRWLLLCETRVHSGLPTREKNQRRGG